MNPDDRRRYIAEAAYYRAQRRGFLPNGELDDWLEAEREFDELLNPFPDAMPSEGAQTAPASTPAQEEPS